MNADEWIHQFAAKLNVAPPDAEMTDTLLDLAGIAAHSSERIAAPIACYLVGAAGLAPVEALKIAEGLRDGAR